jgi:F0F1-type ATP synthase assembly protein I
MSVWFIRPGVNENYAHYLVGLGLGLILGALFGYNSPTFPRFMVGFGVLCLLSGVAISTRAVKDGKR